MGCSIFRSLARAALAVAFLLCLVPGLSAAHAATPPIGEGAWSWFGDPRAVTHEGTTYVGWVDHEGDIKVSSYDHTTRERVTAVLAARLNRDDHANPSIQVRPDGRLVVYYSRHVGPAMHYRVSSEPGDVSSWEAPQTLPVNVPGRFGYTYPNPIRLAAEGQTYLFWRGGNYNPTFSTQADGSGTWSPPRNLIVEPNERPYTKYAQSGGDTIHVAYTNAHPNEAPSVNIYHARIRNGVIERAGGEQVGTLAAPIAPAAGDLIFDAAEPAWVHDVAAEPGTGNPVILFASFPSADDHRYHYARWDGSAWVVNEITPAGESFRAEQRPQDYYSGGLTLDHEDPSRVYLSRQVGTTTAWQVEVWSTANGGAGWTSQPVSAPSTEKNVRPVSPRGMVPFGGDLSTIWMRGAYPNYEEYATDIAVLDDSSNAQPVPDAEPAVRNGSAPLLVRFDGSLSDDPDGGVASWQWDFGDGATGVGEDVEHTYTASGRYFPALTVTDNQGAESTFVEEITVGLPTAPSAWTGGSDGATAHGAVDPENQPTSWYFEYGPTSQYGAVTPMSALPAPEALHQVQAQLPGLVAGRPYHYRLVATNASGTTEGEDRLLVAGSGPATADAYRDAVLATPQLASYWRLGELAGDGAANEVAGAPAGVFGGRYLRGRPGALGPLANTGAGFDGLSGEFASQGPVLSAAGSLEGWFRWRAGTSVMRDHTGPSRGWLLAFGRAETLRYRVGGQGFDTGEPIEDYRDGSWHHFAATKNGGSAALYVDGVEVHSGTGADADPAVLPWHVMRNGANSAFSEGEADEVAIYSRALTAQEVADHHALGRQLAAVPPPPDSPPSAAEPPFAGTGAGGGVLVSPGPLPPALRGSVRVRRGLLVVRGAAGTANRLVARRRGPVWRVSDAAAALRAGGGCRQRSARVVTCRASLVKRIVMYGGTGNDRLTVIGRIRSRLVGGAGADRVFRRPG